MSLIYLNESALKLLVENSEKPEIEIGKASLLIKLLLMIVNVLLWVRLISSPPSKWLLKIQFSIKTVPPIKTTILRLALFSNMQFVIV